MVLKGWKNIFGLDMGQSNCGEEKLDVNPIELEAYFVEKGIKFDTKFVYSGHKYDFVECEQVEALFGKFRGIRIVNMRLRVGELRGVRGLPMMLHNLEALTLTTELESIDVLAPLVLLQKLALVKCRNLKDIMVVVGFLNLRSLVVQNCGSISDIPNFVCGSVRLLDVSDCPQLGKIVMPGRLEKFVATRSGWKSVVPNADLIELSIVFGKIVDGAWIGDMCVQLQKLKLSGCSELIDVSFVTFLQELRELDLSLTSVVHLPQLGEGVRVVILSRCVYLIDVCRFPCSLQKLVMDHCSALSLVQDFDGYVNLVSVDLSHCEKIVNVPKFVECSNMVICNVAGCRAMVRTEGLFESMGLPERLVRKN